MTSSLAAIAPTAPSDVAPLDGRHRPIYEPFELAVLGVSAIVVYWTVLSSPVKGLANQGDYERLTVPLRIGPVRSQPYSPYAMTSRFRLHETLAQLGVPQPVASNPRVYAYYFGYRSSERLLASLAIGLHAVLGGGGTFDLRWLGLVNATVWLAGLAALVAAACQLSVPARGAAVVLLAIAFTDFGYLEYANSFFSEPAEVGFLLLALGLAACTATARRPAMCLAGFVVAAALAVSAKTEDAILAVPLVALGVVLAVRHLRSVPARAAGALSSVAIALSGLWGWSNQVPYLRRYQLYDAVFDGILRTTSRPAAALASLGLSPRLARYAGFATADARSAFARPAAQGFFARMSPTKVVSYYLGHPGGLLSLLSDEGGGALSLRPPYANLPAAGSVTGRQFATRSPWTFIHGALLPHSVWFIALVLMAGLVVAIRGCGQRRPVTSPEVLLATVVMAGLLFVEAPLGGGLDGVVKHAVAFNALFDVILIVLLTGAGEALWRARRTRSGAIVLPDSCAEVPSMRLGELEPANRPGGTVTEPVLQHRARP